jgi:hypothetical protein
MAAMQREFGAAANLEDFERKAQMMDYVEHRAIFEGFNAHLWNPNSGRLLWMTQPAWPSTSWQILSWDYDTQSSFYGVKKACERVHVQLDLPDLRTAVINNTTAALANVSVRARIFSIDGTLLATREEKLNAAANAATDGFPIVIPAGVSGTVFVKLELMDAAGALLSQNFYWYARDDSAYQELNSLPRAAVTASANQTRAGASTRIGVQLANQSRTFALLEKLTVRNSDGTRVLPAYYSDNYVSLLPGETRQIEVECPNSAIKGAVTIGVTGWNGQPITIRPAP